jgi:hypothetical protein
MVERRLTGMIAAAAVLLILLAMWDAFRPEPRPAAPLESTVLVTTPPSAPSSSSQGTAAPATDGPRGAGEPTYIDLLARSETRRRIRATMGTYLNEMLAASRDSMLRRWDDRGAMPVRVWFAPTYAANFRPAFLDAIRTAFAQWGAAGVPVRFDLTADSADAEVVFRWKIQYEIERTGQTDLTWDQDGRVESAVVTLATFDPKGRPMEPDDIRVVALHEIGHLLGLDHSTDTTDIMFPTAKVRELSDRDVRTVLFLYQLPPGSLR